MQVTASDGLLPFVGLESKFNYNLFSVLRAGATFGGPRWSLPKGMTAMTDVRELLRQTQAAGSGPEYSPSPPHPSWNKGLVAACGVLAVMLIVVATSWGSTGEKPLIVEQKHQEDCRGNLMRFPTDLYMFLC
jgi:hypothetical protein